ncbi:MAG: galactose mutarotase [Lachnospiraceae bacterium]|nr:galactose mutarotase [Lachnospiraceae bacterium]
MAISKEIFGQTKDGQTAHLYTITNNNGMMAKFTDFGAILVSLEVPDRDGKAEDVVLGFDNLEDYLGNLFCLGATIGRFANRISGASFVLNGTRYELDKNDRQNTLHSGFNGFHKRLWEADTYEDELGQIVAFTYTSEDGDQGYPGTLDVTVRYIVTDDNTLIIEYEAESDKDTIVNFTNHSYFNMAGHDSGSILDQKVWIDADYYTYVNQESIPNGELCKVEGTPMDFRVMKNVGQDIYADFELTKWCNGYDHNWVLKTKENEVSLVAKMVDEKSGRAMEVYTDLPGMQFYTSNGFDGRTKGKNGAHYVKHAGCCFETQYFPDAINIPSFKQPILRAGEEFSTTTVYKFITV